MELVINGCYGGFGLSPEALMHYAKLKGITLYAEKGTFGTQFYTTPAENRERGEGYLSDHDIPREDPDLIRTVRALGKKANGQYAELHIVEIPDGVLWDIEEYDGIEHISEQHRTWS